MSTIKPSVAERFAQHVAYHRPRATCPGHRIGISLKRTRNSSFLISREALSTKRDLHQGNAGVACFEELHTDEKYNNDAGTRATQRKGLLA